MLERLQRLVELQQIEDRLRALEQEEAELPARRARIAAEREAIETRLAESAEAQRRAVSEQRTCEQTLQDQEALFRKLGGQQSQVKTNEAYTVLLHEMEVARQAISDCETRILEAMEAIESAGGALASAETAAGSRESGLRDQEQALSAREKELAEGIAALRLQRDAARAAVEAEDLSLYSRIATRRRPAVVLITGTICLGCRVDIPPQRYIEILGAERPVTCGHCTRILIHRERLAASG